MKKLTSALALGSLLALGCGPSGSTSDLPGPGDGNDDPSDPSNPPQPPDAPPDPGICAEQSEEIELVNLGDPPDAMIVLDRSGSMDSQPTPAFGEFPDPFADTKWEIMDDALTDLTDAKEQNINFGLMLFPTDDSCGVSAGALVDPAPVAAAAVQSELSNWDPNGGTPAEFGLGEALAAYQSLPVNPDGRYVIFATDGEPNCSDGDADANTVAAVEALAVQGIGTFVIGFGGGFAGTDSVLNDAAQAGGFPKAGGPPYYYEADNAQELADALDEIAGGIITPSCSYELASPPPDPDNVTVLADGTAVPRSTGHTNGWDYYPDESTITFFGSYCTDIESAVIESVDFLFGCQGPQID